LCSRFSLFLCPYRIPVLSLSSLASFLSTHTRTLAHTYHTHTRITHTHTNTHSGPCSPASSVVFLPFPPERAQNQALSTQSLDDVECVVDRVRPGSSATPTGQLQAASACCPCAAAPAAGSQRLRIYGKWNCARRRWLPAWTCLESSATSRMHHGWQWWSRKWRRCCYWWWKRWRWRRRRR
jgi:hypothetical protein